MDSYTGHIADPDGIKLSFALTDSMVSIADSSGQQICFSVQLITEVVGILYDIEKIHCRGRV